jgi:hypothetical protein
MRAAQTLEQPWPPRFNINGRRRDAGARDKFEHFFDGEGRVRDGGLGLRSR